MTTKVFIDGGAGTTGLQIRGRLEAHGGVALLSLPEDRRKDAARRLDMFRASDVSVLCLPDDAARAAVAMIEADCPDARIIDASSAHRVAPGWVYGFPEYDAGQAARIAAADRVTNPGCYAITSVAMLHPLVAAGLVPADWPVTLNAVSGYSGGGKALISDFEDKTAPNHTEAALQYYALGLDHKHVPEIQTRGGLSHRPLLTPAVGRFRQGMIVQLPLQLWALPGAPRLSHIRDALADQYAGAESIEVAPAGEAEALQRLDPEALAGSDVMRIHVFGSDDLGQAVVAGVLDNLGKGAAGQAIQNINLMCGLTTS